MQLLLKNKTTLITGGKGRCVCITHYNELIKKLIADSVEECYTQCCTGYDHAPSYMFEIEPKKGLRGNCPRFLWLYEDAGLIVWDETILK